MQMKKIVSVLIIISINFLITSLPVFGNKVETFSAAALGVSPRQPAETSKPQETAEQASRVLVGR